MGRGFKTLTNSRICSTFSLSCLIMCSTLHWLCHFSVSWKKKTNNKTTLLRCWSETKKEKKERKSNAPGWFIFLVFFILFRAFLNIFYRFVWVSKYYQKAFVFSFVVKYKVLIKEKEKKSTKGIRQASLLRRTQSL